MKLWLGNRSLTLAVFVLAFWVLILNLVEGRVITAQHDQIQVLRNLVSDVYSLQQLIFPKAAQPKFDIPRQDRPMQIPLPAPKFDFGGPNSDFMPPLPPNPLGMPWVNPVQPMTVDPPDGVRYIPYDLHRSDIREQ